MEEITIIMGGSGGLGKEVAKYFPDASNWSHDTGVDVSDGNSVYLAADKVLDAKCSVQRIINCAGINEINPFDKIFNLEHIMKVNAFALPSVVQHLRALKVLPSGAVICNVISNAARIPMTHSLAYNMSKAAQEMATRQMARELKEYTIFGVNPNKLWDTGMSRTIEDRVRELRGWTVEEATRYQLAALPAGVETLPSSCAAFIAELMKPIHHPFITGCIFPYGGPIQ